MVILFTFILELTSATLFHPNHKDEDIYMTYFRYTICYMLNNNFWRWSGGGASVCVVLLKILMFLVGFFFSEIIF